MLQAFELSEEQIIGLVYQDDGHVSYSLWQTGFSYIYPKSVVRPT